MAVERSESKKSLRLLLNNGQTDSGKMRIRTKSFQDINDNATDEQLFRAGSQIGSLYAKDLVTIETVETHTLVEGV